MLLLQTGCLRHRHPSKKDGYRSESRYQNLLQTDKFSLNINSVLPCFARTFSIFATWKISIYEPVRSAIPSVYIRCCWRRWLATLLRRICCMETTKKNEHFYWISKRAELSNYSWCNQLTHQKLKWCLTQLTQIQCAMLSVCVCVCVMGSWLLFNMLRYLHRGT